MKRKGNHNNKTEPDIFPLQYSKDDFLQKHVP
jgi:hypothetical protein